MEPPWKSLSVIVIVAEELAGARVLYFQRTRGRAWGTGEGIEDLGMNGKDNIRVTNCLIYVHTTQELGLLRWALNILGPRGERG